MASRRPRAWYGFLYYLLGAGGSFFAWVICIFGIYVTWREAILWVANREPAQARVADVVENPPPLRRWVRVEGVEIDLASALFAAGGAPGGGRRDRILIDREDAVARAWRDLFQEMEKLRANIDDDADLKRLHALLFKIGTDARTAYIPERALVLVDPTVITPTAAGSPGASAPARDGGAGSPGGGSVLERWRREIPGRIDLVRSAVSIDAVRAGLLERIPEKKREHYKATYKVHVGESALLVGHAPSGTIAAAFAGFAFVLLFLVVGLRAGSG